MDNHVASLIFISFVFSAVNEAFFRYFRGLEIKLFLKISVKQYRLNVYTKSLTDGFVNSLWSRSIGIVQMV